MTPTSARPRLVTADFAPGLALPAAPRTPQRTDRPLRKPLGQVLLDMKAVTPDHLAAAIALQGRHEARLGDILLARGWVSEPDLLRALSIQWGAGPVDLRQNPPDARLIDQFGVTFCLTHALVPLRRIGPALVIACARPEAFERLRARLPFKGPVIMALCNEGDIHAALVAKRSTALIRQAETLVSPSESCRTLDGGHIARRALPALALAIAAALIWPRLAFAALFLWAVVALVACTGLKLLAFLSAQRRSRAPALPPPLPARLPIVSVIVPLFHEDDIAPRLIRRLGRQDYPRELTDILLAVEEDDAETLTALAAHKLPRWMRVITVPRGPVRTKPRALNYALNFARGSIIGVWDAEDAPAPDQISTAVAHFAAAPPDVACLQGVLDFYNARHNWLTRCFAIEYAAWFRAVLPGIARLGLVVPLGGTSLFFRRTALEELGGWDAHNVTEDADLGLRLARHGYRTALIPTVTEEEPNGRALPWVRQRSRWLKGYAITWAVHMRDPVRLWRDLGPRRFLGVQILFFGTLSQYALAPILWSFWLPVLGLPHPLTQWLGGWGGMVLGPLFLLSEVVNLTVAFWATRGAGHRHLLPWVPTLHLYFPLGALASYKALWEAALRPYFWDKTRHGLLDADSSAGPEAGDSPGAGLLILTDPILAPAPRPTNVIRLPDRAVAPPPTPPPAPRALPLAFASNRPVIEFQTSFEGF